MSASGVVAAANGYDGVGGNGYLIRYATRGMMISHDICCFPPATDCSYTSVRCVSAGLTGLSPPIHMHPALPYSAAFFIMSALLPIQKCTLKVINRTCKWCLACLDINGRWD